MELLVSFLYLLLHIAIIVFIAFCIVWVLKWCDVAIDPNVYKVGKIIVALLIVIAIAIWLADVLGHPVFRYPWLR